MSRALAALLLAGAALPAAAACDFDADGEITNPFAAGCFVQNFDVEALRLALLVDICGGFTRRGPNAHNLIGGKQWSAQTNRGQPRSALNPPAHS